MSREDVRLEGYEPGPGFQPVKLGPTRGELKYMLALLAFFEITHLLRSYLGNLPTVALMGIVYGALFVAIGIRDILNPERHELGKTEKGLRRARILCIVPIVIGTAAMTLAIGYILFLWEGW